MPGPAPRPARMDVAGSLLGRDPAAVRLRIEAMERLLEGIAVIPGTRRRIGLDALLGLVPVVGDVASAALGAYIVWEAGNLGLSRWQRARMMANIGLDTAIGAIPLVGDLFDLAFRSNSRNLKLIRRHLDRHHPAAVTIER